MKRDSMTFYAKCLQEKENLCVSVSGTIIPTRELALLPHSPVSLKPRAPVQSLVVANVFFPGGLCKLREDGCVCYEF